MVSILFHSRRITSLLIIQHYNIRSDQYKATFFVSPHETTAVEINGCQRLWKSVLSVDRLIFWSMPKYQQEQFLTNNMSEFLHTYYIQSIFRKDMSFVHIITLKPGVQLPVTLALTSARVFSQWMRTWNASLGCKSCKCFHCCVSLFWLLILQLLKREQANTFSLGLVNLFLSESHGYRDIKTKLAFRKDPGRKI